MNKKVSMPVWGLILAVVLCFGIGGAIATGGKKNDTTSAASTATVTTTTTATITKAGGTTTAPAAAPVTVTKTAAAPPAPTSAAPSGYSDGTYIVGTDIKLGTYKSAGPTSGGIGECYWERSDKNNSPIDNNIGKGQSIVNIQAGDYSVTFTGCQPFVKS